MGVSQGAFARQLGITQQAVSKLVKRGTIPVEPDGTINPKKARAAYVANTDPGARRSKGTAGKAADGEVASQLNMARAIRAGIEARLREVTLKRMLGEYVDASDVESKWRDVGRRARDAILAVPDRLADLVAAETDREKCRAMMQRELEMALEELTGGNRS